MVVVSREIAGDTVPAACDVLDAEVNLGQLELEVGGPDKLTNLVQTSTGVETVDDRC